MFTENIEAAQTECEECYIEQWAWVGIIPASLTPI